ARVGGQERPRAGDDVVDEHIVAPAAVLQRRAGHGVKYVPFDTNAGQRVIQINAVDAGAGLPCLDIVNEIVTNHDAAETPIAPGVDGPRVARREANVVDLVELDDVLVAVIENRRVGRVVDPIVAGDGRHSFDVDAGVVR